MINHTHIADARKAHILTLLKTDSSVTTDSILLSLQKLKINGQTELKCTLKTVMRDIRELKNQGCPIVYSRSRNSYILQDREWELNSTPIMGGDELLLMTMGTQMASSCLPRKFARQSESIARTLIQINTDDFNNADPAALKILMPPLDPHSEKIFSTIFLAWKQKKLLTIRYADEKGNTTDRTIEPQALLLYGTAWYIRSYCYFRCDQRTFAVTRIVKAVLQDNTFTRRPELYKKVTFDNFDNRESYTGISIRLNTAGRQYAQAHVLHSHQQFHANEDGTYTMTVPRQARHIVREWIMSQSGDAVPTAPMELVEAIKETIKKMARKYGI